MTKITTATEWLANLVKVCLQMAVGTLAAVIMAALLGALWSPLGMGFFFLWVLTVVVQVGAAFAGYKLEGAS